MTDQIFSGGAFFSKNFKTIKLDRNYEDVNSVIVQFENDNEGITLFRGCKSQCLQYMQLLNSFYEEIKKGTEAVINIKRQELIDFQIEAAKKEEELKEKEKEVQKKIQESEDEKEKELFKTIQSLSKDSRFEVEQFVKLKKAQESLFMQHRLRN